MQTVLVTGASGFVGSHVVPELLGAGYRVAALVRTEQAAATVARRTATMLANAAAAPVGALANLETRTGDVTSPGTLAGALAGVDAVVHLVALPRDSNGGRDLLRVNLGGTRSLLDAMTQAGVRRLVHVGALGVLDREELHYASSKKRAEDAVAASDLDWTILKPSLLYGPRDGFFNILAGLVRLPAPVVPVPGKGDSQFQPIYVGDLALCVRLSLDRPATVGRIVELAGPRAWTYREMVAEVCRATDHQRILVGMPLPIIRAVAGLSERVGLPFPVATDQLRQLSLDNVGAPDGVFAAFGFTPRDMAGQLGYLRRKLRDQEPGTASKPTRGSAGA